MSRNIIGIWGIWFMALTIVTLAAGCAKLQNAPDATSGFAKSLTQCTMCHGGTSNAAPPKDTNGNTNTSAPGVGAHQAHLNPALGKAVACEECHVVPGDIFSAGHILKQPARVVFGALATKNGAAVYDRTTRTCTTYCHLSSRPVWTVVDGSQKQCTSCHGFPPALPHPQLSNCSGCHGDVVAADRTILDANKHINGAKNVASMNCTSCHGSENNPAPPADTAGQSSTALLTVGAHQAHLNPSLSDPVPCSECHVVPNAVDDPAHIQGQRARVVLGALSRRGGVQAAYDSSTGTCITYCHGQTLPAAWGGSAKTPVWNRVDGTQKQCGACHGYPPTDYTDGMGHDAGATCSVCHTGYSATAVDRSQHLNGVVNNQMDCLTCHSARELCALGLRQYCTR